MKKLPETCETNRLILKFPTEKDFEDLLAIRTDPKVMQYIGNGTIQTVDQVREFITLAAEYYHQTGFTFYSVFEKATGTFVGQAGLFNLCFDVNEKDIELAYRLHKKHWRKGYATELAQALIHLGFNELNLNKIIAITYPENIASQRVMEKAGMIYQGMFTYKGFSLKRYEINREGSL